jgi:phage-related protein
MQAEERALIWVGSSKKDLCAFPEEVRRFFGHALDVAQRGGRHQSVKTMRGFSGAGVLELVEDDAGGTYRAVYTVRYREAVFVLHCFQKKSRCGTATPLEEMDIVRARLKLAETLAKELGSEKTYH